MDYNKIRNTKYINGGRPSPHGNRRGKNSGVVLALAIGALILIMIAALATAGAVYWSKARKKDAPAPSPEPTTSYAAQENAEETPAPTPEPTPTPSPEPTLSRRGTAQPIPDEVRAEMAGVSMPADASIGYDDLAYLTIPHYDFNYNVVEGHLIMSASIAEEVLDIFAELYDIRYPIERMEIVDKYNGSDYDSIDANNTSAFNYRLSTDGSGRLSNHGRGLAVDINPQINPYVDGDGTGSHPNAREYWSRDTDTWSSEIAKAAYIGPDTQIYDIFVNEHGWDWGGSWSSYRDYQHFEKTN